MVLTFLLLSLTAALFKEEDHVIILEDSNFQEALIVHPNLLVEFYAPWCKFCQKLAPMYSQAAIRLLKENPQIRIAKTDATANIESAHKYNIEGYPTFKFFTNGEPSEYTGVKNEDGIVNWLIKKIGPATKKLESDSDFSNFLKENIISVALFSKDPELQSLFGKIAKNSEGNYFAVCEVEEIQKRYGETEHFLVVFKETDEKQEVFTGPFLESEIVKFIERSLVPWIMPFDDKVVQLVFKKQIPCFFLFRKESDHEQYDPILQSLSVNLKGFPFITYADLTVSSNKRLVEFLGLPPNWMPFSVLVNEKLQKFIQKDSLTLESLTNFCERWQKGLEKPFLRSQPIPKIQKDNNVRILVGESFNEVVFDRNFDVLVEFYAPWCGHCKKLAPEYTKLANKYKDSKTLIIAKIDASENEVENFDIQEFPTIKFFPANNKDGIDYIGKKDMEGLERFILDNSALPIIKEEL